MKEKRLLFLKFPALTLLIGFLFLGVFSSSAQRVRDVSKDELLKKIQKAPALTDTKGAVVFSEDFTGTSIPSGWTQNSVGSGWEFWDDAEHWWETVNCDDWLISPAITLTNVPAYLSFIQLGYYMSWAEFHGVYISTSSDMSDAVLLYDGLPSGSDWENVNLDLSKYRGETVYIAFNYQGYDADLWVLDDVTVTEYDPGNKLLSYWFDYLGVDATINSDYTIDAQAPFNVGLDTLTASFVSLPSSTVKVGSTTQVSGVTKNNFTSPVVYTVATSTGLARNYTVKVTKEDPLVSFSLHNSVNTDIMNDTIWVDVTANANLTSQVVSFTLSEATGITMKQGTTVLTSGTSALNVSQPVTISAVGGGTTKNYVLMVSKENPLANLRFTGYFNNGRINFPASVYGTIDPETMSVKIVLPYGVPKDSLITRFSVASYVTALAYNGNTFIYNDTVDFSTDGNLVLTLADPTKGTVSYAVSVVNDPGSSANEILTMSINNLAKDLVWDNYGRKITGEMMYDSTKNILPVITISPLATVIGPTAAFSFVGADTTITYKVTSQNGTIANWKLILSEQAPSKKANITSFVFNGQEDGWMDDDTTIYNIAAADLDLTAVKTKLSLSFGANSVPSQVSNTVVDFTNQPVKYTVTAQDGTTKKEFAAYIFKEETELPVATIKDSTYMNFGDSVMVKVTDKSMLLGNAGFGLFRKDIDVAALAANNTLMQAAVAAGKAVTGDIPEGTKDSMFYLPTDNLTAGIFYAYAGDYFNNISLRSVDSVVMAVDTVEVNTLAEMKFANVVYKYTGQAIVTYTQSYRHQKFIQDASMGIVIDDASQYVSDTVMEGDALTGMIGKVVNYYMTMEFQPLAISSDSAMVVSRGNVVEPMELTFEEFNADVYEYQNMLVKLTNVSFNDADGSNIFTTGVKYGMTNQLTANTATYRTAFYNADYINKVIPEGAYDLVGIKNVSSSAPVFTSRSMADMTKVEGYKFAIDPEEYAFTMVGSITTDSKMFQIMNQGPDAMPISKIYLSGDAEFNMMNVYDISVNGYSNYSFMVNFEPLAYGSYTSTIMIEMANGDVHEVALTGSVQNIPIMGYPYSSNFDTEESTLGWVVENNGTGDGFQWGYGLGDTKSFYRVGYNNPGPAADDVYLISPAINMSASVAPVVEWNNTMINNSYATTNLYVSVDNMNTWELVSSIKTAAHVVTPMSFDISEYAGESKVYFAFYLNEPNWGYGSPITWWEIDDFKVKEFPTAPVFSISSMNIDFGVVDGAASSTLTISNKGVSYFTLNSVALKDGSGAFSLSGDQTSNVDVYTNKVNVNVNFDGTIGEHADTVVVSYTEPRNGVMVVMVPVSAIGVACSAPMAAVEGTNTAPYAPSWFEFTPAANSLITISSCGDGADTDVKVYDACGGKVVAANDDNGECDNNPYASTVVFAAHGGVAYKINWIDTWDASGFDWTLTVSDLPTAPTLLSVETVAVNAIDAKAILTFKDMIQLIPDKINKSSVNSVSAVDKQTKRNITELVNTELSASKDFVPDGDPEVEPNEDQTTAQVITVGTTDAPTKITGHYGVLNDYDWFAVPTAQFGFYFDMTLEVEAGICNMYLVYWNADAAGWYGYSVLGITPDNPGALSKTQLDLGVDTAYIWVRRNTSMAAVAEPGYGYNLKVWSSAPPVFTVYRNNYKIAGPESMPFTYTDSDIKLDHEYCYSVTQELYNASESDLSNSICVTPMAGNGDICSKAIPANPGLIQSPKSPYWYSYTSSTTKAVHISSNIEENGDPVEDWNDTWLFVYANCDDATPLYENDDVENGVIRTSDLTFIANAGVTYLIEWRRWAAEGQVNAYDGEPFYFVLEESSLIDGDYVENAIPLTLPVVDMDGTTIGFTHNYSSTNCGSIYMGGNDVCYSFTVPYGGKISGSITGEWVGMNVIKGNPGSDACIGLAAGQTGGSFTGKAVMPGTTYYVVISTQLPTEETDFVMNLSFTPDPKQMVTFNVDMNVPIAFGEFDASKDSVDIVGTFNFWNHTVNLTDADGDGIYTYALPTEYYVGEKVLYKYRINADWNKAELSNDVNVYRTYVVKSSGNVINDKFDDMLLPTYDVTFNVNMAKQVANQNFDPATGKITLKGSFTTATITTKDEMGTYIYSYTVKGISYGDITYQFFMDGTAETVDRSATIHNDATITVWWNDDKLTDVKSKASASISVYPNPANGMFTVDFGTLNTEKTTVEFVNVDGKVVNTIDMNSRSSVTLDSKTYAKGVYYLRINDGENVNIQKVVIQ